MAGWTMLASPGLTKWTLEMESLLSLKQMRQLGLLSLYPVFWDNQGSSDSHRTGQASRNVG